MINESSKATFKRRLRKTSWDNVKSLDNPNEWVSEFSSYEIELQNRVTQNKVTLRVTNSKIFIEILLSSY